jgi:peptide/nickel transport system substrate-binding protein
MRKAHSRAGIALATAAVLFAGACGGSSSGGGDGDDNNNGSGDGATVIWGSTDKPVSYDPAKAYDLPSWNVIYNVYQTLVRVNPDTLKTEPDAADSCDPSKNFKTWTCTLKDGLTFSNGNPVTAEDVKFSFDRILKIADPSGPAGLLQATGSDTSDAENIKDFTTEAKDDKTVVFHLQKSNALWDQVISTGAGAIVDHTVFPADSIISDESQIIGSGPYVLKSYAPGQTAEFAPNDKYTGDLQLANGGLVIQYYQKEDALKLDIEAGKVDVAYPALSPTAMADLEGKDGVNLAEGPGGAIRYLVFNLNEMPGDDAAQKKAIRRAAAYLIDRQSIATDVYEDTVDPLYSMVPAGLDGHLDVYKDEFGEGGDVEKAKKELSDAGVQTPVNLQLWWTPTHYGELSSDEYTEIKRQLEDSKLFKVDLQSTEWEQYTGKCLADECQAYQLGWFPDYPDTDDYVANFYGSGSFLNNHYSNKTVDDALTLEQGSTDAAERTTAFEDIQKASVADAPIIPIWQGKQLAVTTGTLSGVDQTLKPDYIFRFWVLSKS